MKTEEHYHIDWLVSKDNLLSSESLVSMNAFIEANPQIHSNWVKYAERIELLSKNEVHFSEGFSASVLKKIHSTPFFDHSSLFVASLGIVASVLLMLSLCIEQNSWGFEALLGIADMDANNTNLLFYINS